MFDTMGLVGGLDVHKGHGCGLAILVSFVTEDFHALDPSEPAMKKNKVSLDNQFTIKGWNIYKGRSRKKVSVVGKVK